MILRITSVFRLVNGNQKNNCVTREKNSFGYKDVDYIDDSEEEDFENEAEFSQQDFKVLQFWIKSFLPRVGSHVTHLDLSNCKALNTIMARRIFHLCPNIQTLDISYSSVKDNAFKRVRFNKIESINFEGCDRITDLAFKNLFSRAQKNEIERSSSGESKLGDTTNGKCPSNGICSKCKRRKQVRNIEDIDSNTVSTAPFEQSPNTKPSLKKLNLSGCCIVTDMSLQYISEKFDLENISYLNLSGCVNLTNRGLNVFVSQCTNLEAENMFYCDNIIDGPFGSMANGCENLECSKKFCCRN